MLKEKLIAKAEELGWKVQIDEITDGIEVDFYQYSPAGEDFGFYIYADSIEDVPNEEEQQRIIIGQFQNYKVILEKEE